MAKLRRVEGKRLIKFLVKKGFKVIRQKGSHVFLAQPDGVKEVVPVHPGKIDRDDYQQNI